MRNVAPKHKYGLGQILTVTWELTKRELEVRFRGSVLGLLWAILQPLALIGVYYLVFGLIFTARWPQHAINSAPFLVILFAGLIPFQFFAEIANRAPALVISNANYVKKIVFPTEVLALVIVLAGAVQLSINISLWLLLALLLGHKSYVGLFLLPVYLIPFMAFSLGVALALSAVGVFIRDLAQIVPPIVSLLLFLSPVLYPIEAIPVRFRSWFELNPLAHYIEYIRGLLIGTGEISLGSTALSYAIGCGVLLLGLAMYKTLKRGFADVL
jgi:lipopolysaccharide transport system permease protein